MDIREIYRKKISSCTEHIINVSTEYVAFAEGTTINVLSLDVTKKTIQLKGHSSIISQLHFSAPNILLSSSSESLLSWNIDNARTAINSEQLPQPVYIGAGLGAASFMTTLDNTILLVVGADIIVLDTAAATTRFLEGHNSSIVFCEMIKPSQIISLSTDNHLKVWCLVEKYAIAQFQLLSSASFTSFLLDTDTLYLGSADGMVYVYEPISGTRLKRINVENYLPAITECITPDQDENVIRADLRNQHVSPTTANVSNQIDVNNSVLAILKISSNSEDKTIMSTFGEDGPVLQMNVENIVIIVLTSGVVQLNALSLQILNSTSFLHHTPSLPLAYTVQCFRHKTNPHVVYTDLFNTEYIILEFRKLSKKEKSHLTMVQTCTLSPDTPLLSMSTWKKPTESVPVVKGSDKRKMKAKSSGYSASDSKATQHIMFKPNTNIKPNKRQEKSVKVPTRCPYAYPSEECRPVHMKNKLKVSDRNTPVQTLAYCRDSHMLAAGLGDCSGVVLRLPSGSKSIPLIGHKAPITNIRWGTLGRQVITTAEDKSCKLWDILSGSMIMDIRYLDGNTKNCEKLAFKKDIVGAQFYYIDKFIVLAHLSELYLYKHHVDKQKNSSRATGRYQSICCSSLLHTITAICAPNSYYSTLAVCGLSDKSVVIFDYNKQQVALKIEDAHTRVPHHVRTVEGSKFVSHSSETYNLILSCSVLDDVKLWDVRSGQCVRSFSKSNKIATAPSMSSCVRYVAIPGEDHVVYLFDIRGKAAISKIQTDNPLTTTFSPKYPQLAVGTTEGVVTFYNDR